MALLDRVPNTRVKHSLEENLALIDSRIQYLDELKAENKRAKVEAHDESKDEPNNNNDDEFLAPLGQPIECFENRGIFFVFSKSCFCLFSFLLSLLMVTW